MVEIIGRTPVEFAVSEIELCTIFSNLFQNVADELQNIKKKESMVRIHIEKGKHYVRYEIWNTMREDKKIETNQKTGLPKTSKNDAKNHGIGLLNIKESVERCEGEFRWSCEDSMFFVSVTLPIL